MQLTPIISFRGIRRSPALEADILSRLRRLETYHAGIMACRVMVELVQRRRESGNRFHIRIDLTVPGGEILVAHEASLHTSARHTRAAKLTKSKEVGRDQRHAQVAVRKAFETARRRLQDFARRQRGSVKTLIQQAQGLVSRMSPVDEYGYIKAEDGHEVYFQKSAVLRDGFAKLAVGSPVSFVEEPGEKGPQASTVRLLHPHRGSRAAATLPKRRPRRRVS